MANAQTAVTRRSSSFDIFQPIWRLLTSVRFAVFFIGALALVGLAGVLIPQIPEAMRGNPVAVDAWVQAQEGTFGPLTQPMHRLGLFNVFNARWFLIALAFLVVNVSVCVFNRWSPTFRNVAHPPERVPDTFFERAHNRTTFAPVDPAAAATTLRSLRFAVRERTEAGATYLFADRYPWAQLATFVSHLALILFIAGGLVTSLTGFTADRFAGEGTTFPVFAVSDPNQMQVRIDDAVGRFGERGNALDFRTHITIFQGGEEVKSGYTTVNDPLEYDGYRFHQVAFLGDGAQLRIRDTATGNTIFNETFPLDESTAAPVVTVVAASGETLFSGTVAPTEFLAGASGSLVSLPGPAPLWIGLLPLNDHEWQLVAFDPSSSSTSAEARIAMGESARIARAHVTFEGVDAIPSALGIDIPGSEGTTLAQLAGEGGDQRLLLIADNRPAIALAPGEPVRVGSLEYVFEGQREFAGISVKRDSGAWFIWTATGLLLAGLAVTFYVPRRRLWLKLTPATTQIAALAEKSGGFEKDMRILARRLDVPVPPELEEER
jgi:cytochrome c biogenesis protein